MQTIVGHCPKCGAPIYSESIYWSILPPAPIYTCSCVSQPVCKITTEIELNEED